MPCADGSKRRVSSFTTPTFSDSDDGGFRFRSTHPTLAALNANGIAETGHHFLWLEPRLKILNRPLWHFEPKSATGTF